MTAHDHVTAHDHPTVVPGCYRCDLSRDEVSTDRIETETCALCAGVDFESIKRTDDLALCNRHWNRWLGTFVSPMSPLPPCAAHVIRGDIP